MDLKGRKPNLMGALRERVISGLKRKSITKVSEWAEMYRIMGPPFPGPWSFTYHPWLREMCDSQAEVLVGRKAAQMGFTEVALNLTFATLDLEGSSVLYVLPSIKPDATDFSTSRFDPALEASEHLSKLFTDVKNTGHKRAGHANLYIRGSRSRSQMKSLPAAKVIFDEVAEMVQENITLAMERMSGQRKKQAFLLSTPTIARANIDAWYLDSDQRFFAFKCPRCGRFTELIFPDCLVITSDDYKSSEVRDSYLVCKECKGKLEHEQKQYWLKNGIWVPKYQNRNYEGHSISQLYSSTVKPHELAVSYLKGQYNPEDEQEFFNSKLGLPHEVKGARVTETHIINCIIKGGHKSGPGKQNSLVTMGVDVGKWLHFEIVEWFVKDFNTVDINTAAVARVLEAGKVLHFEELDRKMIEYKVNFGIGDAEPEGRKMLEFCQRFWGQFKRCRYVQGITGRQLNISKNQSEHLISVDRTSWMDVALGRFKKSTIMLPADISEEYKHHVRAPVRVYKKDRNGNPTGRYVTEANEADHFAHARTYCEIALPIAASLCTAYNIEGIM